MQVYRGMFSKDFRFFQKGYSELQNLAGEFGVPQSQLQDVEILWAEYKPEDTGGNAWVLFRKDGQLYEVNGSHCSCHGLENQWKPEITSIKSIMMRPDRKDDAELVALLQQLDN